MILAPFIGGGLPAWLQVSLTVLVVVSVLGYLYTRVQPKPLPGIPHRGYHRHILGDLPDLVKYRKLHGQNISWMTEQCQELNSPMIQLFLKPFAEIPLIVLNDFRETEDIITRRTHQFDQAPAATLIFEGVVPKGTISMPSHDVFKAQRRLWAGTMSTDFLHRVAAPQVFRTTQTLVELWRWKAKLAPEVPFNAVSDMRFAALDAIWAAAVGTELGALPSQLDAVSSSRLIAIPTDDAGAAVFPQGPLPPLCHAIDVLLDSMAMFQISPYPKVLKLIQSVWPKLNSARSLKNRTMQALINESRAKFTGPNASDKKPTCAMEQVLQREAAIREKQGSFDALAATEDDSAMIDELFVWLVAGHETTVTTLGWGFKHLNENRDVQLKLRAAITAAIGSSTISSSEQIIGVNIPYLDAVVWEMLRLARTAAAVLRVATVDTQLLGCVIPKGAHVLMSTSGFSVLNTREVQVDESRRSAASRQSKKTIPWDPATMKQFIPERWLKQVNSDVEFDMNAGPILTFGGGPRGCFGRRLAMIELKLFVAQLVLAFDFHAVPEELNSYAGVERITRQPRQSYVRLRAAA